MREHGKGSALDRIGALISGILAAVVGAVLLILLLPLISLLLAIALGVGVGVALVVSMWAYLFRRKVSRLMRESRDSAEDDDDAPRPSKIIDVTIRKDE